MACAPSGIYSAAVPPSCIDPGFDPMRPLRYLLIRSAPPPVSTQADQAARQERAGEARARLGWCQGGAQGIALKVPCAP